MYLRMKIYCDSQSVNQRIDYESVKRFKKERGESMRRSIRRVSLRCRINSVSATTEDSASEVSISHRKKRYENILRYNRKYVTLMESEKL
jgi:protein tyrosine phosphatase